MTRNDIDRLFQLLAIYYPTSPKVRSEITKQSWFLVLEPFDPEDVKKALVLHMQTSKHFPFVQEISTRCKLPATEPTESTAGIGTDYANDVACMMEWLGPWHEKWEEKLHGLGLPTFGEAVASGMTTAEWNHMMEEAGVLELCASADKQEGAENQC